MGKMVYKCAPENQDKLQCIHLEVLGTTNPFCPYRTERGYCAKLTDLQMKAVVDKLASAEESMERKHQNMRDRYRKQVQ